MIDHVLGLSDRGAGVPLRELALVGLTAAIVTYFAIRYAQRAVHAQHAAEAHSAGQGDQRDAEQD